MTPLEEEVIAGSGREADRFAEQRRIALNAITDFAYIFDLDGRFTFVNKPLLDLWGLTLDQAVGKNFFELRYPDALAAKLQEQIQQVIRTKQRLVDETEYTSPSGATGWYQYILSPVIGSEGSVEAVAGSTRDISELKRTEAALRLSREQMEIVVRGANVGVWYCPLPFDKLIWDEKVKEHFHLSADAEVTIDTFYGRLHPHDRERTREAIEKSIEQRQPYEIDYRTVSADGKSVKWIKALGRGFYDAEGKPTRFDGITLDISARKEAEEALRSSEGRLRIATDAAELGIWVWHVAEDRGTWENDRLYEIFGIARSEEPINVARFLAEFVYPEDAPKLMAAITETLEKGARYYFLGRFRRGDGELRWIEFTGLLENAADGSPLRILGTAADVTERKRAEDRDRKAAAEIIAAAEANAKFRTFFDQGTYFAGVMALDGTIIEANRLWLDGCGFTREEVIGKKFWECGWWNRSPALVEMIQEGTRQAAAGQTFRQETNFFVADGSERVVELTLSPVTDDAGRVLFIAPTGTDITEKKRLADERERLLDAERTARAEAEEANRAKDKFLAVLSHELRTPLSPVVMTIPAMELDPEMPFKYREDLAMVRRNIDLEVKLIDDLLDLSRVTSGKLRLQMQPVHVHELLRHAIHSSMSDSAGKRLRIRDEFQAVNDRLTADPARLQQVFWNLLRNAIKFTPDGGEIIVRTLNGEGQRGVRVEIQDTGVGIPAEVLPRIFDAFEQGNTRVTHQFGGLGLGLAIAKAVVEMHGGKISAASGGRDQGATFAVELDTMPVGASAGNLVPDHEIERREERRVSKILLVEDHPDTARTMARLLRGLGFEVKIAHSVASALHLAAEEPFDVVVSDIGLPDATGYELMEQIRARYSMKGIALSGYGMEEDVRKSREAGFAEHLVKPVDIGQLQAALRRSIGGV